MSPKRSGEKASDHTSRTPDKRSRSLRDFTRPSDMPSSPAISGRSSPRDLFRDSFPSEQQTISHTPLEAEGQWDFIEIKEASRLRQREKSLRANMKRIYDEAGQLEDGTDKHLTNQLKRLADDSSTYTQLDPEKKRKFDSRGKRYENIRKTYNRGADNINRAVDHIYREILGYNQEVEAHMETLRDAKNAVSQISPTDVPETVDRFPSLQEYGSAFPVAEEGSSDHPVS